MILKNINHSCSYDTEKICTIFFPDERIKNDETQDVSVITKKEKNIISVDAIVYGKAMTKSATLEKDEDIAYAMSVLLFDVLSSLTGFKPPWGILFGVRPAKLMHRYANELGEENARNLFIDRFLASPSKANLALEVMNHENRVISLSQTNSFSLYISIPFCPTRCNYCSFVSHSIERTQKLVNPYVELLCKELEYTSKIAKDLNLRLETIYWGGGTPTTLSAEQLSKILTVINDCFVLNDLREYTVEAGRPDTITEQKLFALKKFGVDRISINPQTFNDNVLVEIGRRHTAQMTVDSFLLARECGFDNINMDLIAGLPCDTLDSFRNSVDSAISLGADSVTIHTLAKKSASYIVTEDKEYDLSDRLLTSSMVDYSYERLKSELYHPYYMYRQSKSLGNLENVGWAQDGRECLYNVFMMDETHSVFAVGAGAVTRLINQNTGYIERIYNYKYPYEYIDHFDEVLKRKDGIISFYQQ